MAVRWAFLWLWIASVISACGPDEPRRVFITVDSELSVDELNQVRVETYGLESRLRADEHTFVLGAYDEIAQQKVGWPFTFPVRKNNDNRFLLVVTGLKDGRVVLSQSITASFLSGRKGYAYVFLGRGCLGVECPDPDETCHASAGEPSGSGTCAEVPEAVVSTDSPSEPISRFEAGAEAEIELDAGADASPDASAAADAVDASDAADVAAEVAEDGGVSPGADDASGCDAGSEAADGKCGPLLAGLSVDWGSLTPAFDPAVVTYEVDAGPFQTRVGVTAYGEAGHELRLNGASIRSGEAASQAIESGDNRFTITVTSDDGFRDYTILVRRPALVERYLKAPNADRGDEYGFVMALSGDGSTLAVSALMEAGCGVKMAAALQDEDSDCPAAGAVYVMVRDGEDWAFDGYLKAKEPAPSAVFGSSVALSSDGTVLVVGAFGEDEYRGAVHVFQREASGWSQPVRLTALNRGVADVFGRSVSISGDGTHIVAGAPSEDSCSQAVPENDECDDSGAVYLFSKTANGWSDPEYIKPPIPWETTAFGGSVSLSATGSLIAVGGSPTYVYRRSAGVLREPAVLSTPSMVVTLSANGRVLALGDGSEQPVRTYARSGDGWRETMDLKPTGSELDGAFGQALGLSGDGSLAVVGARDAVHVFTRAGDDWSEQRRVLPSAGEAGDAFGTAVAVSEDGAVISVGASEEDSCSRGPRHGPGEQADNGCPGAGAAYLFDSRVD